MDPTTAVAPVRAPGFFRWWYTAGLKTLIQIIRTFLIVISDQFSLIILLKTLLTPWKKDIISAEGLSLRQKFNVWLMNLISRLFGAFIRSVFIVVGTGILLALAIFGVGLLVVWLTFPALIILGFYISFGLISG